MAANGVSYIYPNGDPFFGAQDEFNITYGDPKTTVYEYWASKLVTSLGCIDQFQICNPNKVGLDGDGMLCTPLASVGALPNASEHIGLDMIQVSGRQIISYTRLPEQEEIANLGKNKIAVVVVGDLVVGELMLSIANLPVIRSMPQSRALSFL